MMSDAGGKPSQTYQNMKQQRLGKGKHTTPEGRIGEAEVQNAKAEQGSEPNTRTSQWHLAREAATRTAQRRCRDASPHGKDRRVNPKHEGRIGEAEVHTQIENTKAKQGSERIT